MKKLLFITYGGGHVNTLLPIIKKVEDDKVYDYEVIALTTAVNVLKNNGIKFSTLKDHVSKEELEIGESIAKEFHVEGKGISYKDTATYYGIGLSNLIDEYGEKKAYSIFEKEGRKSFLPIKTMKRIISCISPDVVITTSSPRVEEASLIAARILDIPTIRVEQFFSTRECKLPKGIVYCVMNDLLKEKLIERGIDSDFINVTGQPAFDKLFYMDKYIDTVSFKAKYNIDKNNKIVLLATQHTDNNEKILNQLLSIEKNNENITLIIKPHPNEDASLYFNAIKLSKSNAVIIKEDLHSLIINSDIVLIEFSTVGLETILLDKDLITINITEKPDIVPYAESGAAVPVYKLAKLEKIIKDVLADKDIQNKLSISRKSYRNDGRSTERVISIINKLI